MKKIAVSLFGGLATAAVIMAFNPLDIYFQGTICALLAFAFSFVGASALAWLAFDTLEAKGRISF